MLTDTLTYMYNATGYVEEMTCFVVDVLLPATLDPTSCAAALLPLELGSDHVVDALAVRDGNVQGALSRHFRVLPRVLQTSCL